MNEILQVKIYSKKKVLIISFDYKNNKVDIDILNSE